MSNQQRFGLIAAGVVVAVVAFLLLKPGDDDGGEPSKPATQTTTTSPTESTTPAPETEPETTAPKEAQPEVPPIEIENGKPVAGVEEFQFEKGDTIVFRVTSDEEHEIHLHGYDVSHDVPAGATSTFKVKANIEGIFEVEIEDTKTKIAEITVKP
jgi:hypothetical protein